MKVYDAENQILGRLSSHLAKELLGGEKIIVVNAEKAVISGNPKWKTMHYKEKYERGDPIHGPFFPKQPDRIFKRTVRGMLPWDRTKGRVAHKNLKVYVGVPDEFKLMKREKFENADAKKLKVKSIPLGSISLSMGAKKRW